MYKNKNSIANLSVWSTTITARTLLWQTTQKLFILIMQTCIDKLVVSVNINKKWTLKDMIMKIKKHLLCNDFFFFVKIVTIFVHGVKCWLKAKG